MARLFDPHRACSALAALPPRGQADAAAAPREDPAALEQALARKAAPAGETAPAPQGLARKVQP